MFVWFFPFLLSCSDKSKDSAMNTCQNELSEEDIGNLTISLMDHIAMQAGGESTLSVGTVECCVYVEPVDACVDWSISPSEGASIDENGVVKIDEGVDHGSVFNVEANVEDGRRTLEIPIYIIDVEQNPLYGRWSEHTQISCDTGEEVAPEFSIAELYFYASGKFDVTWDPFEAYRDYWGGYTYNQEQGTLLLNVEGGNYVPTDIDGEGTFSIDENGDLHLESIWLGSSVNTEATAQCGHIFRR